MNNIIKQLLHSETSKKQRGQERTTFRCNLAFSSSKYLMIPKRGSFLSALFFTCFCITKPLLIKIIGFGFSLSEELCISQSLQEDNNLLDLYNSSYHTHPYPIKLPIFSSPTLPPFASQTFHNYPLSPGLSRCYKRHFELII